MRVPWAISALNLAEVMVRAAAEQDLFLSLVEDLADLELDVPPVAADDAEELAMLRAQSRLRMPDCCALLAARQGSRPPRALPTGP